MRRVLVALLALLGLALSSAAALAGDGRTPRPVVAKARAGTQCVEDPAVMRRTHMSLLKHQRDDTVHGGIRGARHSLKGCIDCHAGAASRSVARGPDDFCVGCHRYAAVRIDCFECHASSPAQAQAVATPATATQAKATP